MDSSTLYFRNEGEAIFLVNESWIAIATALRANCSRQLGISVSTTHTFSMVVESLLKFTNCTNAFAAFWLHFVKYATFNDPEVVLL